MTATAVAAFAGGIGAAAVRADLPRATDDLLAHNILPGEVAVVVKVEVAGPTRLAVTHLVIAPPLRLLRHVVATAHHLD